jgi:hypothetical protein
LRCRSDALLGRFGAVTAWLLAAAAFMVMLNLPVQLPSIPGAPGLPNLYVPVMVWAGVDLLIKRLRIGEVVEKQIDKVVAAGLGVVCIAFIWSSLASPTHRSCAESDGEDCVRYEVEEGADTQSAFMWGIGAYLLISMAVSRETKAATDTREWDDASDDE